MTHAASIRQPDPAEPSPTHILDRVDIQIGAKHKAAKQKSTAYNQGEAEISSGFEAERHNQREAPEGDAIVGAS